MRILIIYNSIVILGLLILIFDSYKISTTKISRITDRVTNDIASWQNRALEPVYLIVWMNGIVFKVRENSKVINKTMYIAVGLRTDGRKDVLGLWLGKFLFSV